MRQGCITLRWADPDTSFRADNPAGLTMLDGLEHQRYWRLQRPEDRRLFLAAHILRRLTLEQVTGIAASDWRFEPDALGKPLITVPKGAGAGLHVSLAHTPGLVIVGVTDLAPLGVDVERRDRIIDAAAVRCVMTPMEQASIALHGPCEAIRFWSLKEAYAKATGQGQRLDFAALDFACEPPRLHTEPLAACWFKTWSPQADHIAAVALLQNDPTDARFDARPWS